MRHVAAMLCVLVVLSGLVWAQRVPSSQSAPPSTATSKPSAVSQPASQLKGEYGIMASVAKLGADQRESVAQVVAQREKALADWDKANMEKSNGLELDLRQARRLADEPGQQRIQEAILQLAAQRTALDQQYDDRMYQIMNSEQRLAWEGFVLTRMAKAKFRRARLSNAQLQQLQELSKQSASQAASPQSALQRRQMHDTFLEQVSQQILTLEQRQAMQAPVRRHQGSRPAPAAGGIPGPREAQP